jgi:hypothetical protein
VTHEVVDNAGREASSASVRVTVPTTSVGISGVRHAGGGSYLPGSPFSGVSIQGDVCGSRDGVDFVGTP